MNLEHSQRRVTGFTEMSSALRLWIPCPCLLPAHGGSNPVDILKGLGISLLYGNADRRRVPVTSHSAHTSGGASASYCSRELVGLSVSVQPVPCCLRVLQLGPLGAASIRPFSTYEFGHMMYIPIHAPSCRDGDSR